MQEILLGLHPNLLFGMQQKSIYPVVKLRLLNQFIQEVQMARMRGVEARSIRKLQLKIIPSAGLNILIPLLPMWQAMWVGWNIPVSFFVVQVPKLRDCGELLIMNSDIHGFL
jgi:hypothetical protein